MRARARTAKTRSLTTPLRTAELWGELAELVLQSTPGAERRATDVLDLLEAETPLIADTLPHKAATLALESFQGGPPHVAASACHDVQTGLMTSRQKRELSLLTANVTSWRAQLMPWICDQRPDIVMVQETRHRNRGPMESKLESAGYSLFDVPGFVTPKDGTSGGMAIAYRRHLNLRNGYTYCHEGNGFTFAFLRVRNRDIALGTIYLVSGAALHTPANVRILAELAAFTASLCMSWLIIGDWNLPPEAFAGHNFDAELRGTWITTGSSTVAGGGELDYALASPCLGSVLTVEAEWDTPFRPHAALRWRLGVDSLDLPMPQLQGFKRQEVTPQPYIHTRAKVPEVLGQPCTGPLDQDFADLSASVSMSTYGGNIGRGCKVSVKRTPLAPTNAPQPSWGGRPHALWQRLTVALEACVQDRMDPRAIRRGLHTAEAHWFGDNPNDFILRLQQLLEGNTSDAPGLAATAKAQSVLHLKAYMQSSAKQYRQWLTRSSVKGMRPLFRAVSSHEKSFLRPFRKEAAELRPYLRWEQWAAIWRARPRCSSLQALLDTLRQKAILQAQTLPPITRDEARAAFCKVAAKAPGLDGWEAPMLTSLSDEALDQVLSMLHQCEALGQWPVQITTSLIAMLPKKDTIERPIALLHYLYRGYMRCRYPLVSEWTRAYCNANRYDQAAPGRCCLDVALRRLLRSEITKVEATHGVTLFVDLQTFFDTCRYENLVRQGEELNFPPIILNQAIAAYSGNRVIVSENLVSPVLEATAGILAGCPAAPSIAKLAIHPIASELLTQPALSNLDAWIDDLTADVIHRSAVCAAAGAVKIFRLLQSVLDTQGMTLSATKTCFVTTSSEVTKALTKLLAPGDPRIQPLARDLGVDSGGAKRRRFKSGRERHRKASARGARLARLAIPATGHKLRIFKGSVVSAGLWGHQSTGMAPKYVKWYRTMAARQLTNHRLYTLDLLFAIRQKQCEDPFVTILRQHMRTVLPLLSSWCRNCPTRFSQAWRRTYRRVMGGPPGQYWRRVTGPLAATMAYLADVQVFVPDPFEWQIHDQVYVPEWESDSFGPQVTEWLLGVCRSNALTRIARLEGCEDLKMGVDCTVARKVLRRATKGLQKSGLEAVVQGGLLSHSKPAWCHLCECPVSLRHQFWDCAYWAQKPNLAAEPRRWQQARVAVPYQSLWLRGLLPMAATAHPEPPQHLQGVTSWGLWCTQSKLQGPDIVYATDGSGGPGGPDPRLRVSSWSIAAFSRRDPTVLLATKTCIPWPPLSPAQAEQAALCHLMAATEGPIDVTIDCKSLLPLLRRSIPPNNQVPWADVWPDRRRVTATWVPSHLSLQVFTDKGFEPWRHRINQVVDRLCGDAAQQAYSKRHELKVRRLDALTTEVLAHLARKAAHILHIHKTPECPWQLLVASARPSQPIGPNKKQLLQALLADTTGHSWKVTSKPGSYNMCVACSECKLWIQQVHPMTVFHRLVRQPCVTGPAPWLDAWPEAKHATHTMSRCVGGWRCAGCQAFQKPGALKLAPKLSQPCRPCRAAPEAAVPSAQSSIRRFFGAG